MKISRYAAERLLKIKWLENLGREPTELNAIAASSREFFLDRLNSTEWENTTLDAGNEITGLLAAKYPKEYQYWNALVREAKKIIEHEVIPIVSLSTPPKTVMNNIRWDSINFLMEDAYKAKLSGRLFFADLIVIYEAGHMPCSWEGKWPNGKLVIY